MINVTKEELLARIEKLEERMDRLMGKPRGPISMMEYRLACERKDKAVIRAYLKQENERTIRERSANSGESTKSERDSPG